MQDMKEITDMMYGYSMELANYILFFHGENGPFYNGDPISTQALESKAQNLKERALLYINQLNSEGA